MLVAALSAFVCLAEPITHTAVSPRAWEGLILAVTQPSNMRKAALRASSAADHHCSLPAEIDMHTRTCT